MQRKKKQTFITIAKLHMCVNTCVRDAYMCACEGVYEKVCPRGCV